MLKKHGKKIRSLKWHNKLIYAKKWFPSIPVHKVLAKIKSSQSAEKGDKRQAQAKLQYLNRLFERGRQVWVRFYSCLSATHWQRAAFIYQQWNVGPDSAVEASLYLRKAKYFKFKLNLHTEKPNEHCKGHKKYRNLKWHYFVERSDILLQLKLRCIYIFHTLHEKNRGLAPEAEKLPGSLLYLTYLEKPK